MRLGGADRLSEAEMLLREAIEHRRSSGNAKGEVVARLLLANVLTRIDPPQLTQAERVLRSALDIDVSRGRARILNALAGVLMEQSSETAEDSKKRLDEAGLLLKESLSAAGDVSLGRYDAASRKLYSRHRSGMPLSSCTPASSNTSPEPAVRSLTVDETRSSRDPARPAIERRGSRRARRPSR
jgi:hypothetical protein